MASLKPVYKKILPKETNLKYKELSTSPIVVRSHDGSTIQLVRKPITPSTSIKSSPQLISAGSLNPIMLPYPAGTLNQSPAQAQFQIRDNICSLALVY